MRITRDEYDTLARKGLVPQVKPVTRDHPKYRNKTEALYAMLLADAQKAGEVSWWAYEPVTLVVVDARGTRIRFTPDFMVVRGNGPVEIEFVEVKGWLREDAKIKFLAARERYPFFRFRMVVRKNGHFKTIMGDPEPT